MGTCKTVKRKERNEIKKKGKKKDDITHHVVLSICWINGKDQSKK